MAGIGDIDLSKMFDSMSTSVNGDNPIKAIYDIVPTYDSEQQKMLFSMQFLIDKWELTHIQEMLNHFDLILANNKNLSFFGSRNLQNMLGAYTQTELIRGINIRSGKTEDVGTPQ